MAAFAAFQGADRLNGGSAEGGEQSKQEQDGSDESNGEEKYAPVGREKEACRVVRKADAVKDKGR